MPMVSQGDEKEQFKPGSGVGRSHGTSRQQPFDRWFRYPAGFASDYVAHLLNQANVDSGTIVDTFAGSGVTGTAAQNRRLGFIGIEAHPLMVELARLKLDTGMSIRPIADNIDRIVAEVESSPSATVPPGTETDLVTRSFDSEVLASLITIRQAVQGVDDPASHSVMKWALLATLRDVANVKVGWPYQRPGISRRPRHVDALACFTRRCDAMLTDLRGAPKDRPTATIQLGDASDRTTWTGLPKNLAACVTSPPYLNNFDYADATRLELYFWGDVRTWKDMVSEVRVDMLTATTQQSSVGEKARAEKVLAELNHPPAKEIIKLSAAIRDVRNQRGGRTKEYDQVTAPYFTSVLRVLENLSEHLATGAPALWLVGDSAPYGVHVDTPRIIGQLAETVGLAFESDQSLRVRGNRWAGNSDRHQVALSERLITMRKQ